MKLFSFFIICFILGTLALGTSAQEISLNNLPDSLRNELKFVVIDKNAEYPGGMVKFYDYLQRNLKFPKEAKRAGITGRVFIIFTINKDGSIDQESVRVYNAQDFEESGRTPPQSIITDPSCENEAIRLILKSQNWIPALHEDKPVKSRMVIPVIFN
jgi:periplasmic protein TonB